MGFSDGGGHIHERAGISGPTCTSQSSTSPSPAAIWLSRGCPSDPPNPVFRNSGPCDWPPPHSILAYAEGASRGTSYLWLMEPSKRPLIGEKDAEGDSSNKRKVEHEEDLYNKRFKQIEPCRSKHFPRFNLSHFSSVFATMRLVIILFLATSCLSQPSPTPTASTTVAVSSVLHEIAEQAEITTQVQA